MKAWERFGIYKEREEWVLQFMAQAARRRFAVWTPWGETRAYDVGIEHGPNFLRVQVKSSSYRRGDGYCCQLLPNHVKKRDYSLEQIDLFAAYVIPVGAWYLIPASLVLGVRRITCVMLSRVVGPYGWGEESGFGAEGLPQRLMPEFIGGGYGTTEVVPLPNFHCSRFRVLSYFVRLPSPLTSSILYASRSLFIALTRWPRTPTGLPPERRRYSF